MEWREKLCINYSLNYGDNQFVWNIDKTDGTQQLLSGTDAYTLVSI